MKTQEALLRLENVWLTLRTMEGNIQPVRDVSFRIHRGECVALVGESGSGKTLTGLAVMGLLPPVARVSAGRMWFEGRDLKELPEHERCALRGDRIGMIFQEPMTSLHPAYTVGWQMCEALQVHRRVSKKEARRVALEKLRLVGMSDPERRLDEYPHKLSGGMRQRVMIAMALMCDPDLLIADEPTTALDVTIQAQILELLQDLQKRLGLAILLITHDMGVVAHMADRVCVMRNGQVVEQGDVHQVFASPAHEYTRMLLGAVPKIGNRVVATMRPKGEPLVAAKDLQVHFRTPRRWGVRSEVVQAVDGVSLSIEKGETLAVVGESGCGKSTLALAVLNLIRPTAGEVLFGGARVADLGKILRRSAQIVFQDPMSSLDPRMTVGDIVAEPLVIHRVGDTRAERERAVAAALEQVALESAMASRYPHEFSGGQRQRIGIARALILEPSFLVLDEPTSALDVSVQAEVLKLLGDLRREMGLTMLFITHNLAVVSEFADRVAVMYLGAVVETGDAGLLQAPQHPYTQALLSASPVANPVKQRARQRITLPGGPGSQFVQHVGCRFAGRCVQAQESCRTIAQVLKDAGGAQVACHLVTP